MWNLFNPFFPAFTIISLIVCGLGLIYFLMGISQFATGYVEKDRFKKQGGLFALLISILVITGVIYSYFEWIWIW